MQELLIPKVGKSDIDVLPSMEAGNSIVVLERHEHYVTDLSADNAGSLYPENARAAFERGTELFGKVFAAGEARNEPTMVLFAASDTRYGKGYRSMETAWIAQNAAISALNSLGLRPSEHILNLDPDFATPTFRPADAAGPIFIRPEAGLREPQFFDTPEYVNYLREKYGSAEEGSNRLSQQAWAAHERDAELEVREALGAEGVYDILARTKRSLSRMRAYSNSFHVTHPDRRLIFWADSHYDTISPLVKDTAGISFGQFLPVEHGGGVVVGLARSQEHKLFVQGHELDLRLGNLAAHSAVFKS